MLTGRLARRWPGRLTRRRQGGSWAGGAEDPSERGGPRMSAANVALARQWFEEVWNQRRAEAIDKFLTPESVGHLVTGDVPGADAFREQVHAEFLRAFPDLKVTVEETVAEGDTVVVRWCAAGRHGGDAFVLKATHRQVEFRG